MKPPASIALCAFILVAAAFTASTDERPAKQFRAGAAAVDITPQKYPVRVNGMFTERSATRAIDPLYAKAIALDDGSSKLVMCVVDTCMMPRALIERAKSIVNDKTGLATVRMMVSATHTHSAPSVFGCLGSRVDPDYAAWLPAKIAEAMIAALENLQPARVGWASVDDWENTHNRRWILRADRIRGDPYGNPTVRANMHPGYQSRDIIGPSGPVDPELGVLAVQSLDGKPLALMANYSQHYFGSGLLSADYFGAFSRHVAKRFGEDKVRPGFVAIMSQGTSGDLMWMDYGAPPKKRGLEDYAAKVAQSAARAYAKITWHDHVPIEMAEKKLTLPYRVPDAGRLAWAKEKAAALGDRLPRSQAEIYAKEAVALDEAQRAEITLQAIRIGELGIATLPNEVYAITGLKLKAQSPLRAHINIELANGADGYIPPPEQHGLGGYTTWPARSAGLETGAEPKIVETLLGALEEVAGKKRRAISAGKGAYSKAILNIKPLVYWRLDEIAGDVAHGVPDDIKARIVGRAARYLPGAGSGSGCGAEEALRSSPFSGPQHINRAIHLVDGRIEADLPELGERFSIALWFWLGERSGASDRAGTLVALASGDALDVSQSADHLATVSFDPKGLPAKRGTARLRADEWHLAVLVRDGGATKVFIDGMAEPAIASTHAPRPAGKTVRFGDGLEGKLDEIAVFNRPLNAEEIASIWGASGIAEIRAKQEAERARAAKLAAERAAPPAFAASYTAAINALKPTIHTQHVVAERTRHEVKTLGPAYSVSLWFKNELANDARPVTAYLVSRGPDGDRQAPGDHLGIGGIHQPELAGKLIVFNGNASDEVAAGSTVVAPGGWNHIVLIRDGGRVRVYLNGAAKPEIDAELTVTTGGSKEIFTGARSDRFAPLDGFLTEFALFERAVTAEEARILFTASGQPIGVKAQGKRGESQAVPEK